MTILVFTKTNGYRHESIPAGVTAVRRLSAGNRIEVTEEFPAALDRYRAVVFLNTIGEVLDDGARAALTSFVRGGGGFVGVHGAAATEYDWPDYGDLLGARFAEHPAVCPGVVRVADGQHPATAGAPAVWPRTDEWYTFRSRPDARVLLTLDDGPMGAGHPLAWCHERWGGRVFYTALGHTVESYSEAAFLAHLGGGLAYATGDA